VCSGMPLLSGVFGDATLGPTAEMPQFSKHYGGTRVAEAQIVTVRLTPEQYEWLQREAKDVGTTLSWVLRDLHWLL
jgi:hypothetical protein